MTKLLLPIRFITLLLLESTALEAALIRSKEAVALAEVQETEIARESIGEAAGEEKGYIVDVVKGRICPYDDPDNCYPLEFEPETEWKLVRPHQRVPPGLEIRMNLDIGGKEARLSPGGEQVLQGSIVNANTVTNTNNLAAKINKLMHREKALQQQEKRRGSESENQGGNTQVSQFAPQFEFIQRCVETQRYQEAALTFEEIMEYAHDYKYGLALVTDKFEFITDISFDTNLSLELREVATRFILSCLRNNPPVVQYITTTYPDYFDNILTASLEIDPRDRSYSSSLVGRYISILRELLNRQNNPDAIRSETPKLMDDLFRLYPNVSNSGARLKILEIVSQYLANVDQDQGQGDGNPPTVEMPLETVQYWATEFSEEIQDPETVDELHVRQLFNALYAIKRRYKSKVKLDSSFMNWLDEQVVARSEHLNTGASGGSAEDEYLLVGRDLEQDEFDRKLIDSNHNVFGNPMAARIKNFRDEL